MKVKSLIISFDAITYLVTAAATFALMSSVYQWPVAGWLASPDIRTILSSSQTNQLTQILTGGIVSAFSLYMLVEKIPAFIKNIKAKRILNKVAQTIIDGLNSGYVFSHEMPLRSATDLLVLHDLYESRNKLLCYKADFLCLKAAGEVADSRYSDFQNLLGIAITLSTEHAWAWIAITDKVRLLQEALDDHPGCVDHKILELIEKGKLDQIEYDNPTMHYYMTLTQRSLEYVEELIHFYPELS